MRVLQSALAVGRPGRYQIEAAIAALHDDLVALSDGPVSQDPAAVLGRAVAVGHVDGPAAGLLETDRLREVLGDRHRYAEAAHRATNVAERDDLVRRAARARASAPEQVAGARGEEKR